MSSIPIRSGPALRYDSRHSTPEPTVPAPSRSASATRSRRKHMSDDVWIIGAAMTPFGRYGDKDVIDLASEAAQLALGDAGLSVTDIQVLVVGNVAQADKMVAQRLQQQIGQTGIPAFNVANACAT